ncbi:MAG TPA: hypothetical protein VJB66_03255 [Candidatus Nanoarchaeia archaeon]|nr:hypothetical protein [Candidatus Nanoarchaeia archaeon]
MAKYDNSKDREVSEIVIRELEEFKKLIRGHEKLLWAVGKL